MSETDFIDAARSSWELVVMVIHKKGVERERAKAAFAMIQFLS